VKKYFFLSILFLFVSSCAQPLKTPGTFVPTAESTNPQLFSTTTNTFTLTPASTSLPQGSTSYYVLQILFTTSSDWSTFQFLQTDYLLALQQTGDVPTNSSINIDSFSLNQTLDAAQLNSHISMSANLAISSTAAGQKIHSLLQKGDLGESTIEFYLITQSNRILLQKIEHKGVTKSGRNPLFFDIDLDNLLIAQPSIKQIKRPAMDKMVWAFYYMWYSKNDWKSPWLKDWPITIYSSSDPVTISNQVDEAKSSGIDGFISSWWGPGSDTDNNLQILFPIAEKKDFKIMIYFESLAGPNGSPLDANTIYSWLAYAINKFHDEPSYMKIDGKPVIVLWASETIPLATWGEIISKLNSENLNAVYLGMGYDLNNLTVFDGIHDYGIFSYKDLAQKELVTARAVRNYSIFNETDKPKFWVATVQPGYDDTLQPSRQGLVQDRNNGTYYESTWQSAISSDPDWIFITTWNEWYEHTHIEPSKAFGDQYLLLTKKYSELWKNEDFSK
jgi:hypothetical protein